MVIDWPGDRVSYDYSSDAETVVGAIPLRRANLPASTARRADRRHPLRRTVYLNGKFYVGVVNGVHRTADRLVRELDALQGVGEHQDLDLRLLMPARSNWAPALANIRKVSQALGHNQFWEQCILPFRAGGGVLVNLANLAPIMHHRKLSMIHDAQFVMSPQSFPFKFSLGYRLLTPLVAASSARVLTVSEYARDSLAAFHISKHSKTDVVYNGGDHILEVEPDRGVFERLDLHHSYALLFGNTAVYKNVTVVFEAFRRCDTGVRLVILGAPETAFLAAGMSPPKDAIFTGQVSDRELRALYESATCLLFPSRTEGFGLPPVEAMMCGCPVVVAPAGAIPEVCRDAALYADIFAPDDWAGHVQTLHTQPAVRRAKIDAGRQRSARFTWRAAGRNLFEKIADQALI